jgi:DNA modification methylase
MNLTSDNIAWISELAEPERERGYTRTYYSYPAKFLSKLPRGLIKLCSRKGELVFDPFVGGGTTGLEAMLLNRQFIGYDLNPFAILVSKVKTTYIKPELLEFQFKKIIERTTSQRVSSLNILDKDDMLCLGVKISHEINSIFESISNTSKDPHSKRFFELALIHTIKIVGRRDFESRENWKMASILPIFIRKVNKMIREMVSFPKNLQYIPKFILSSNHKVELGDSSVDLIITSSPYCGKDIEYQQIQIQRRTLNRSKRSNVISAIMATSPLSKKELCWGKGATYWKNNLKSLCECYRVLIPSRFAFFWNGFKLNKDLEHFQYQMEKVGFNLIDKIQVKLSDDRAASGRSTHHKRKTRMMSHDYLFITQKC